MTQKNIGILYITIKQITNVSNIKSLNDSTLTLNMNQGDPNQKKTYRKQVGLINGKYSNRNQEVDWVAICQKIQHLELFFQFNQGRTAFITFPLEKLIQMPRVKHTIECKLIQKQKGQIIKPIKEIVQVELQIIYLNNLLGKFIISNIQAFLTRNTELIGKMDPYVQIQHQNEIYKTNVKEDEGTKCFWDEKIEIPIKFINQQGMKLNFSVYDKDNFSSDLVGSKMFILTEQNFLVPTQQLTKKSFNIYFQGKEAGNITLKYQFVLSPFNF